MFVRTSPFRMKPSPRRVAVLAAGFSISMRWAKQRTTTRITRTVEIDAYTVGQPYRRVPHGTTCLLTPSTGISIAFVAGAPVGVRTDAVAFHNGSAQKIAPKSGGSHSARVVISARSEPSPRRATTRIPRVWSIRGVKTLITPKAECLLVRGGIL